MKSKKLTELHCEKKCCRSSQYQYSQASGPEQEHCSRQDWRRAVLKYGNEGLLSRVPNDINHMDVKLNASEGNNNHRSIEGNTAGTYWLKERANYSDKYTRAESLAGVRPTPSKTILDKVRSIVLRSRELHRASLSSCKFSDLCHSSFPRLYGRVNRLSNNV